MNRGTIWLEGVKVHFGLYLMHNDLFPRHICNTPNLAQVFLICIIVYYSVCSYINNLLAYTFLVTCKYTGLLWGLWFPPTLHITNCPIFL
jgi:hypothetical protein